MLLSIIILLLQFLLGSIIYSFVDRDGKFNVYESIITSFILGLASSSYLLLFFLLITGTWSSALYLLWSVLLVTGIFVIWKKYYLYTRWLTQLRSVNLVRFFKETNLPLIFFLLLYLFILIGVLWVRYGGIVVANFPAWGDAAYHLDMIAGLKNSNPFVLKNPVLAGEPLTYPFLVNLLTALYEKLGASLLLAWNIPVCIFGISFVLLVYFFGKRIFSGNRVASVGLVVLLLYGSGFGFIWYFHDIHKSWEKSGAVSALDTAANPPEVYTHLDTTNTVDSALWPVNIDWIVPSICFFSHQRSFIPGIAMAILILMGIITYRGSPNVWRWGIVWGMLPLFHAHSFIAVSIVLFFWFIADFKYWKSWILSGLIAALFVLPQLLVLIPDKMINAGKSSFMRLSPGWVACKPGSGLFTCIPRSAAFDSLFHWMVWFWTANFGLLFWTWLLSLIFFLIYLVYKKPGKETILKYFLVPGLALFIIPNLIVFQPWDFDNNKILIYWWFFASVISIYFINRLFEGKKLYYLVIIFFVLISSLSGFIDVLGRISDVKSSYYGYYGQPDIETANWIKNNTEPNSSFLTGDQPTQFIPMLTGRSIYLGYQGWLWSQGKNSEIRKRVIDARNFLSTGNSEKLCEKNIKYILWDKSLLTTYPSARYDRISSSTQLLYTQKADKALRQILKIKCIK